MGIDYSYAVKAENVPQTEPASPAQVPNAAGGFTFAVDTWTQVRRFLILGAEGGTFYVGERKLIQENAKVIEAAIAADPRRLVDLIVQVSDEALAPKNEPAIFALALVVSNPNTHARRFGYAALHKVCRTSTHLFHFLTMVNGLRGWSAGLKRAVQTWYMRQRPDQLETQVVKYRQRDGWTHLNVLQLAHPHPWSQHSQEVFEYLRYRDLKPATRARRELQPPSEAALARLPIIKAFEDVQKLTTAKEVLAFLKDSEVKLPWEALPTKATASADVLRFLLPTMGMTALVRQLGKLSARGVLPTAGSGLNADVQLVCKRLTDVEQIRRSRMHPMDFLLASKIYARGHGEKSDLSWGPVQEVVDALQQAFYLAFQNVEPTGKNYLVGLDISGSMGYTMTTGSPISCREAGAALATVLKRTEPWVEVMGFGNSFVNLGLSKTESLRDFCRRVDGLPFQATDCSLPIEYAIQHRLAVDVFVVITDNETFAGRRHPHVALQDYRRRFNPKARMVVMAMSASGNTIADPSDAGMMDVVGFDASVPTLLAAFAQGKL